MDELRDWAEDFIADLFDGPVDVSLVPVTAGGTIYIDITGPAPTLGRDDRRRRPVRLAVEKVVVDHFSFSDTRERDRIGVKLLTLVERRLVEGGYSTHEDEHVRFDIVVDDHIVDL